MVGVSEILKMNKESFVKKCSIKKGNIEIDLSRSAVKECNELFVDQKIIEQHKYCMYEYISSPRFKQSNMAKYPNVLLKVKIRTP